MSLSSHFEKLGAPLTNNRWSWGAVRESDQTIFLRVWQDMCEKLNPAKKEYFVCIDDLKTKDQSHGANERRDHVNLIKNGYNVFLVMCQDQDDNRQDERSIKDFNDKELFVGDELIEHNGALWMKYTKRIPVQEQRKLTSN